VKRNARTVGKRCWSINIGTSSFSEKRKFQKYSPSYGTRPKFITLCYIHDNTLLANDIPARSFVTEIVFVTVPVYTFAPLIIDQWIERLFARFVKFMTQRDLFFFFKGTNQIEANLHNGENRRAENFSAEIADKFFKIAFETRVRKLMFRPCH